MARISMDPEQAISYGNQIIQNSTTYNNEIKKIYSILFMNRQIMNYYISFRSK